MRKIKLLIILFFGTFFAQAQTPQHRMSTGATNNAFPFGIPTSTPNTTGFRMQALYLPADLTPVAINGNITRVYFQNTLASTTGTYANLEVKLGDVTTTVFPGSGGLTFYTGLTQCYNPTLHPTTTLVGNSVVTTSGATSGWFYIDLDVPFLHDATKTLIVEINYASRSTSTGIGVLNSTGPSAPNHKRLAISTSQTALNGSASQTWTNMGFDIAPPTPCITPTSQATALNLTPISSSQIDGSFTAAATPVSGYLVVRYPTGATPTDPTDANAYLAGASLGSGTVVYRGPLTTFTNLFLVGNTTYDYYIYTYNNTSCSGGPKYNIISPLMGTQSTAACSGTLGTIPIGPGLLNTPASGFTSLTNAMAYISSNGIGGNVILELQTGYDGTTTNETFPITFPFNACVTPAKTIIVRPAIGVTGLIISNPASTPTILISGGQYITIDGSLGGNSTFTTGTNLQIINTSGLAPAIQFENDADHDFVKYCDVMSNNSGLSGGLTSGVINFGGTTGANGNDLISITNSDIHNVTGGNPVVGINTFAVTGTTPINDSIIISACNIYDYFHATNAFAGISVNNGNNAWNINSNKFYQTAPRVVTGTANNRDVSVNNANGNGFKVNSNIFGYNSVAGTGDYTLSGATTHTLSSLYFLAGAADTSQIQGNIFRNYNVGSASLSAAAFSNINVASGLVNVGNEVANNIGADVDASGTASIVFTNSGLTAGGYIPLFLATGNIKAMNNTIQGIKLVASAVTANVDFNAIATNSGTMNIQNNFIGSLTTPKSIYYASSGGTGTGTARFNGFLISASGVFTTLNFSNNIISNLFSENNATATSNIMRGISMLGNLSTGTNAFTFVNNTIANMTCASNSIGTGASCTIAGIGLVPGGVLGSYNVTQNKIYNLVSSSASLTNAITVTGIVSAAVPPAGTNIIGKNFIHSLSVNAVNPNAIINGIECAGGTMVYSNNMIRLGIDANGNSITTPLTIRGIMKSAFTSNNFYFNSISLGGTGVGTTVKSTFAFIRSAAATDDIRNNVFMNNRSNATTGGKHYQIYLANLNTLTINYNDYFGNGTGNVFGFNGTADVAAYTPSWVVGDINSKFHNPNYINELGNAATVDLHLNSSLPSALESTGIAITSVTDDFDSEVRASLTPTDMGADAINLISLFICSSGNVGGSVSVAPTSICENTTATVSLIGFDYNITGISYQWQVSNTAGGPYTNVVGGTGATTPVYVTAPLPNGNYYFVNKVTCSNCGPCDLLTNETVLVVSTISAPIATGTSQCGPGLPTASVATSAVGTGQFYWYGVPTGGNLLQGPPLQTYYTNDFNTAALGAATVSGNASIAGNELVLHTNLVSQFGSFTVNGGTNSDRYQVDFDLSTVGTPNNMADGVSYSFGDDAVSTAEAAMNAENGTGTKLKLAFVAYGGSTGVFLMYNSIVNEPAPTSLGVLAHSTNLTWRNTTNHVTLKIDDFGKATVTLGNTVLFNNIQLPAAYLTANRTTWKHVFKGRTGAISMGSSIDNLVIQYSSSALGSATYLTPITTTTTFYVSEKGTNGCFSARTAVTDTIIALPIITGNASPTTICAGNPLTLTGSSPTATSYTWTGGVTDAVAFPATTSTVYTVTGSDGVCSSTATISVNVNPVLTGVASATPTTICPGTSVAFTSSVPATCSGLSYSGFSGPYAPSNWTVSNVSSNGTVTTSPTSILISRSTNGINDPEITGYQIPIGCAGNVTFNWNITCSDVAILASPKYSINGGPSILLTGYISSSIASPTNQSGTQTIALNAGDILRLEYHAHFQDGNVTGNLTISNFSAPDLPLAGYSTYYDAPTGGTNFNAANVSATPTVGGTFTYYAAYIVTTTGCENVVRTPVNITVHPSPTVIATASDSTLCVGDATILSGSGASTYTWEPGTLTGTPSVTPVTNETYTVTGTDGNSCTATDSVPIVVNPLPLVTASSSANATCNNTDITLTSGGASTYVWNGGYVDGVPFAVTADNTYTVTGTDANTCSAMSTVFVAVTATSANLSNANAGNILSIPGLSNGLNNQTASTTKNYYSSTSCNLIASINSINSLGITTTDVTVDASVQLQNGQPFAPRWFQITPTVNDAANVTFYLTQNDFDVFNIYALANGWPLMPTGPTDVAGIGNIRVTKNDNAGIGINASLIVPNPSNIVWNAANSYWEITIPTPGFSQFRFHTNIYNAPLSVTFGNFTGKKLTTSNELSWTTESEQNNAYFNLQHSVDGTKFETINRVNSTATNGNSNATIIYTSVHNQPKLGHNYYRLEQVDIDGKTTLHSKVIDLMWGNDGSTVSIYPNPATSILNIEQFVTKACNTTIKLVDMSGRMVEQIQMKSEKGLNQMKIDLSDIATGVYSVQVYENNQLSQVSKMTKQ